MLRKDNTYQYTELNERMKPGSLLRQRVSLTDVLEAMNDLATTAEKETNVVDSQ